MEILNTKSYKEIESLINLLISIDVINSNKEEKNFRYEVYDRYNNIVSNLIKKDFEAQNEIDEFEIYFMLYQEKFYILKTKCIECAKKFKDRVSLSAFFKDLAKRIQLKIDAKGGVVEY